MAVLFAAGNLEAFTPQFPLKQGWLGGDTAASIPLDGRHRILWLFSDTYVRADTSTNRHGAGMVNNSMAVTSWDGYSTNINYYIRGRDQGAMTSVFPSPGSDTNGAWWYWVMDGFKYNGKVYVFLDRNRRTSDPAGALSGFEGFAVDMAVMDNVDNEPNPLYWPLTLKMDVLDSTNIMPGVSTYVDAGAGYAYLWGNRDTVVSGWHYRSFLLFRVPLTGLDNPGANLQYYTTANTWAGVPGSSLSDAKVIMGNGSPDYSIRLHPDLGVYVDIQCDDGFPTSRLWERTSTSMTAGWPNGSGATTLVTLANEPGYMPWPVFYYAAKEHLEFYSPVTGQALLTYCGNSVETGATSTNNPLNNNSIYVPIPRWVQLRTPQANHPPSLCTVSAPSEGQAFAGPAEVTVQVEAADADTNDSIILVNVFLDGALAASTGTAPFRCTLRNVPPGSHTIYAEAYDTAETKATSGSVNIAVLPYTIMSYEEQVLALGPLFYWRFNETNGSSFAFEYYNHLNAVYGSRTTNGVAGVLSPPFYGLETNNAAVSMNAAVSTPGAGYVTAPALNLNTDSVTIVAWVYPYADITTPDAVVFSRKGTYPVGLNYYGDTRAPNELGYTWNHGNTNTYRWLSRLYTPPGQWSFTALSIGPAQAILYVGNNGTLAAATNAIAHGIEAWDGPTAFGADTLSLPGRIFNGKIDEVAVFDYTLSPGQIGSLYSTAVNGGPVSLSWRVAGADLVLSWPHGTLLQAPSLQGPWSEVPGATPPSFTVSPTGQMFYRVQVSP